MKGSEGLAQMLFQSHAVLAIEYRSDDVIKIYLKNLHILTTWNETAP